MTQALPYKYLRFDTTSSLNAILDTPDGGPVGYIIEIDFEFPVELHDKFKEYPPAPQTVAPNIEWFSEFQRELAEKHGIVKKVCIREHLSSYHTCTNIPAMSYIVGT